MTTETKGAGIANTIFYCATNVVLFDPGAFVPNYVRVLREALDRQGASVRVITSAPLFDPSTVPVPEGERRLFFRFLDHPLGRWLKSRTLLRQIYKGLSYPAGLLRTWNLLRDENPGVFHAQWLLLPAADRLLLGALRRRGWRIVVTIHDLPRFSGVVTPSWGLAGALRMAHAVHVHSPGLAKRLTGECGLDGTPIEVIPQPAEVLDLITPEERLAARRQLGLPDDKPVALFFGLIKPYKGLDLLIGALPDLLRDVPDARIVIAGEPMMPIEDLREQARQAAGDRVLWRLGYIPKSEVRTYFAAADLLACPYHDISASGVSGLAVSHGVPVLATSVGAFSELIEDGVTGWLVPPEDPAALAGVLARALSDRTAMAEVGRQGREHLLERARADHVAGAWLRLYESLSTDRSLGRT